MITPGSEALIIAEELFVIVLLYGRGKGRKGLRVLFPAQKLCKFPQGDGVGIQKGRLNILPGEDVFRVSPVAEAVVEKAVGVDLRFDTNL